MEELQSTALEKEMDSDQNINCHSAGFGISLSLFTSKGGLELKTEGHRHM